MNPRKLMRLIRHLARRFGIPGDGTCLSIPIAISKTRIAGMIDVRAETAIRMISAWKKRGWLEWLDDRIVVPNLLLLEQGLETKVAG